MLLDDIRYFQSEQGRALLAEAAERGGDALSVLAHLRKTHPPAHCRAAVSLIGLRKRAQAKFLRAENMFFDREGLEQSSGEVIAAHRAARYRGFVRVADLCCGVGGDAIALARTAQVIAVDISPHRAGMARENAAVHGLEILPVCADVARWMPEADALFFDPSRREDGRRLYSLKDYHPSVCLEALRTVTPHIGIKVAPGLPEGDILPDCEIEFISESGVCKEAVLWFGGLRTAAQRRATLLPGGHSMACCSMPEAPVRPPGAYIAEPDNAVVRAHLIDQLAGDLNAWKLAPDVAYLSADHPLGSPFVQSFAVVDVLPFNLKRLQRYLSDRRIGRLDIKKRRFPLTPDALRARLKLKGDAWAVLFLTRIGERPTAIVCEPHR